MTTQVQDHVAFYLTGRTTGRGIEGVRFSGALPFSAFSSPVEGARP